jgi:hypothetical protein
MKSRRKGVASVVGTVIFVLVFMLALGAMAYEAGLESQGAQSQLQADAQAAARGGERVEFSGSASALAAVDLGGTGVVFNHLILDYPNGTVYAVATSAALPAGGGEEVASMVPAGACSPGSETCMSRYDAIVSGAAPGSSVGLLTSLGDTFWYYPGSSSGGAPGYYGTGSVESTTSTTYVGVPGLSFDGASGQTYVVQFYVGFWQSGTSSNPGMFALSAPSGTTFMFCGGTDFSIAGSNAEPPSNVCTSQQGASLGETQTYPGSCTSPSLGCEFLGTAFVTFGPAGTFQLEFEGMSSGAANVMADSYLVVTQLP